VIAIVPPPLCAAAPPISTGALGIAVIPAREPILHCQIGHPLKVPHVACDHDEFMNERGRGNLQVRVPDRSALSFQMSANFTITSCGGRVERQNGPVQEQRLLDPA
jgi:hypothetical protein